MRIIFFSILSFIVSNNTFGQNFTRNFNIKSEDPKINSIATLWQNYLSTGSKTYWDSLEVQNLGNYNILDVPGIINPSLMNYGLDNRILSIKKLDEHYLLKSIFTLEKDNIFAITNVIVKSDRNGIKLSNYLFEYIKEWNFVSSKYIDYYCTPRHEINHNNIKEAENFYVKLCEAFDLYPEKLTYFIANDCDDIFRLLGYEYIFHEGNSSECGYFVAENNFVLATQKGGENHYHEITHFINKFFPHAHSLLLTGISAYFGGNKAHFGKSLDYHIPRVNSFLIDNPQIDLSNFIEFTQLDNETNPQYVIGAIVCELILEKKGKEGLIQFFKHSKNDNLLYQQLTEMLNIDKKDLDSLLRSKIDQISQSGTFTRRILK